MSNVIRDVPARIGPLSEPIVPFLDDEAARKIEAGLGKTGASLIERLRDAVYPERLVHKVLAPLRSVPQEAGVASSAGDDEDEGAKPLGDTDPADVAPDDGGDRLLPTRSFRKSP